MLIRCGMFPSDDTWLIYWRFLWKDHTIINDNVMIIYDDYGVFHIQMIWCEWFCATAWRYDIFWGNKESLSWWNQDDELISICRHTLSQDDDIYTVISWELMMNVYRLLVWMLLIEWSRSYSVYDSCWWLLWSCLDIWSLL